MKVAASAAQGAMPANRKHEAEEQEPESDGSATASRSRNFAARAESCRRIS